MSYQYGGEIDMSKMIPGTQKRLANGAMGAVFRGVTKTGKNAFRIYQGASKQYMEKIRKSPRKASPKKKSSPKKKASPTKAKRTLSPKQLAALAAGRAKSQSPKARVHRYRTNFAKGFLSGPVNPQQDQQWQQGGKMHQRQQGGSKKLEGCKKGSKGRCVGYAGPNRDGCMKGPSGRCRSTPSPKKAKTNGKRMASPKQLAALAAGRAKAQSPKARVNRYRTNFAKGFLNAPINQQQDQQWQQKQQKQQQQGGFWW